MISMQNNLRLYAALNEGPVSPILLFSLIVYFQWSRVTMILRLSKTFGPMIEIISAMIKELFVFTLLFFLIFLIFLFTGKILFFQINEFSTYNLAAQYLFYAILGGFSFETFNANMVISKYIGYAFIILYVVFTNITLLNFLIAILSDIYAILKQK